jgi:TPR repeat protein
LFVACSGERESDVELAPQQPQSAPPTSQRPEVGAAEPQPKRPDDDPATRAAPCGDAEQCYANARSAERAGERARAAELLAHACDLESGQACFRLGTMLRDGSGVKPSEAGSRELFERGCRYGSTDACDALGH